MRGPGGMAGRRRVRRRTAAARRGPRTRRGLAALAIVGLVPPPARAPVAAGGLASGVLVLLALPLLWRPFGVATNPGLHDGDYVLAAAVALGVVWLGALILVRHKRREPHSGGRG